MQEIESLALQNYQNNISYLQQYQPTLHKKMLTLEAAIETGQFSEKYELEYLKEYFDIKENSSQNYLYGSNSITLAKEMAKKVNQKKNEQIIQTLYDFNFNDELIQSLDESDIYKSPYSTTAEIINYVNQNTSKEDSMKNIYKYVFLGVGLGLHLSEIHKKMNSLIYYIVEDDIELFRLSLFVTDYTKLSTSSMLFFSISESGTQFKENFQKFLSAAFIQNNYIKYSSLTSGYTNKIKEIQSVLLSQPFQVYTHDRLLLKSSKALENMKNSYKFLDISKQYTDTVFSQKKVLFLAAGPSLEKNILWIKQNQDKFIIVTVFAALKSLESASISPDVIIHIDERAEHLQRIKQQFKSLDFIQDSLFVFAASSPNELLELFNKNNIYLIQDLTFYKKDFGSLDIHSVGEAGYALMLLFGAHDLCIVGLDLSIDSQTGQTHSSSHASVESLNMDGIDTVEESATLSKTILKIKGNFEPLVATTALLYMSVHCINMFTNTLKKPYQNVYNLSNGAFFDGSIPILAEEVKTDKIQTIEKNHLHKDLQLFLDARASGCLREVDLFEIETRIDNANFLKDIILFHAKQNFPNTDLYIKAFTNLIQSLVTPISINGAELTQVFAFYTQSISGYITDLFNTKGLSNAKRHIKKIDKMLTKQLLKIVDVYIDELNKIKEK